MFAVAFALLALVAVFEGAYILRPGWFRSASPATVVPDVPLAAAPKAVAAESGAGRPKEASESTGTTGAARGGRLSIRSEPSGAQVSIDGRSYGLTPLTLAVTPGERRIVLKLDGREVRQTVRVEPGGTASVIAPMSKPTTSTSGTSGWIAIVSKAELDIFEDGVLVGSTRSPQVMMPTGLHTLRLVNETLGYERTQQIRVEPGKVARVSLALPDSTIHLNAQPWAEVWIDGKSVGETPIGNLPLRIGTHEIVFRHPELGEKTVSTVIKAGAPTRVTVDLRK
ncbi:MAG: PEGA domain-containing protein [Acidobacteria bacterium]|nr:PEGA domain-containing protein [Acidobacteriota bacterium]